MARYQVVTLRVPFDPDANEDPPYRWDWSFIDVPGDAHGGVTVLDSDPVSDDPDVQPIERLPSTHSILCQQGNPDDDCGACATERGHDIEA